MKQQDFDKYMQDRILYIENAKLSENINKCNVLEEKEQIVIFSGKNESFIIDIGKYKGSFYDGVKLHCRNGGRGFSPSIGEYRKPYSSVFDILEKNIFGYMEYKKSTKMLGVQISNKALIFSLNTGNFEIKFGLYFKK